jgi:hypothetical protein
MKVDEKLQYAEENRASPTETEIVLSDMTADRLGLGPEAALWISCSHHPAKRIGAVSG